jgi:hypothetical protein
VGKDVDRSEKSPNIRGNACGAAEGFRRTVDVAREGLKNFSPHRRHRRGLGAGGLLAAEQVADCGGVPGAAASGADLAAIELAGDALKRGRAGAADVRDDSIPTREADDVGDVVDVVDIAQAARRVRSPNPSALFRLCPSHMTKAMR